jgi:hypothetical protein
MRKQCCGSGIRCFFPSGIRIRDEFFPDPGEIFLRILVLLFFTNKTCSRNHKKQEKGWFFYFSSLFLCPVGSGIRDKTPDPQHCAEPYCFTIANDLSQQCFEAAFLLCRSGSGLSFSDESGSAFGMRIQRSICLIECKSVFRKQKNLVTGTGLL